MSEKILSINPDLFSTSKRSKSSANKTKKIRPTPLISPNVMKQKLLQKIKEHREKNITSSDERGGDIGKFSSEFQDSMEYLRNLTNKPHKYGDDQRKRSPENSQSIQSSQNIPITQRNKSLKNPYNTPRHILPQNGIQNNYDIQPTYNFAPVEIDFPQEPMILPPFVNTDVYASQSQHQPQHQPESHEYIKMKIPETPYGCLKNGIKPTYRNWVKKTQKIDSISHKNVMPPTESVVDNIRQQTNTNQLVENNRRRGINTNVRDRYLIKRTRRKKYILGKRKKRRTISVLIKGNTLRTKVIQEKISLHNTKIQDIKNYLKKHGLLKSGSSCPDDVLRKMYESVILAGYVKNNNKDVLIHNFLND